MQAAKYRPGELWTDTDGRRIEAHGGGVLQNEGVYYWFGENKAGRTYDGRLRRVDVIGMSCYSSRDLLHWRGEGVVLRAAADDPGHDLHPGRVAERPKVVYNERSNKFVMWMHIDTADYGSARAGVALSDRPTGPYTYLGSLRPGGYESRDLTVFQDADGSAYLFFASDGNATMRVCRLSDDYLQPTGAPVPILCGHYREAPAVCEHQGLYYLITSGCTGWEPNPAEYAVAHSPLGPWRAVGDPCLGTEAERATTFASQSTYILPVAGRRRFIFMADRWNSADLGDSRYVWLPLEVEGGHLRLRWRDDWDLAAFAAEAAPDPATQTEEASP